MQIVESSIDNLRINREFLFNAERKVADFILDNLNGATQMNVSHVAKACEVSDATVIRMCKHLGYKGFYQLKVSLAKNLGEENYLDSSLNEMPIKNVNDFFSILSRNMKIIGNSLSPTSVEAVVTAINNANTIHIIGFGNTINVALDFAFRLGRMKIATTSSFSDELELSSINLARYGDVIIGISHSGGSECVINALKMGQKKGLTTVAITDLKDSPVEEISDYVLCTSIEATKTYVFGAESHMNMMAVTDLLLYLIAQKKATNKGLEMFFSETTFEN